MEEKESIILAMPTPLGQLRSELAAPRQKASVGFPDDLLSLLQRGSMSKG